MLRTTLLVASSSSSTHCLSVCKPSMRSLYLNFSFVLINGDDTSASNSNNPSRRLTLFQFGIDEDDREELRAACGLDGLGETCLYELRFDDLQDHGSVVVAVDEHSPQCHIGDDGLDCAQLADLYRRGFLSIDGDG
ncbi:hypothetical protein SLEP1_g51058 [Rubroshorea leprosula]|uniref:Uncharacterized protein n=1 Tax=Rubroshorea leprosula TaxID=152421 RepID=A0AAV5M220_9ROSI|nr:hypothetical protein SLEP1_g51058 [Rubroshorea leprosula]